MTPAPQDNRAPSAPAFGLENETLAMDRPALPPYYTLESRLGIGGMGAVWLARDTRLGRQVALKIPRSEFTSDPSRLQRFLREARAASALNHPNIITIYEAGEFHGVHYIATEYIEGQTLRQYSSGRRLSAAEIVSVGRQIAAAVDAAHRAGIVHRDLKPDNVMIRPDGLIKVLDFGVAHVEAGSQASGATEDQTQTIALVGTPLYMAPEQARGKPVDARADIFSLGVMLYELAAGETPFRGDTQAEVFAALLEREPPPLADPGLERAIRLALAKDPAGRHSSMQAFSAALSSFAPTHTIPATAASNRSTSRARWIIPAAATVALASALAWFFVGGRHASPTGPMETVALTTFPGSKAFTSFSPDGSQIAFAWDGGAAANRGGLRSIYIKVVGEGEPVRLTSPTKEDESYPAWSPDGRQIAFLRGKSIYLTTSLPNTAERKIGDGGSGLSWSPDGKTLAITSLAPPGQPSRIQLMDVATGKTTDLTSPVPPRLDHSPAFSPDGRWVAFARTFSSGNVEAFIVPASGGADRALTNDRRLIDAITWTPDSREIVFSSLRTGGRALWRVSRNGGAPQLIETSGRSPIYPSMSRQGNRLAYTDARTDTNIYLFTASSVDRNGGPAGFSAGVQLIASTRDDHSPRFSPDAKKLLFVSNRSGAEELWTVNPDGSAPAQLTRMTAPSLGSPAWSPDGRWIAFDTRVGSSSDVYVVSSGGDTMRRFTPDDEVNEGAPVFSRDGKHLYFASNRSGKGNYYRQRIVDGQPVGEAVQLTTSGALDGFETPDGKWFVVGRGRANYGLLAVPVEGGPERPYHDRAGYWRSWGINSLGLYYITKENTPRQTAVLEPFGRKLSVPLFQIEREPLWYQPGLSMSEDGRLVAFAQRDHVINELLMVENFR